MNLICKFFFFSAVSLSAISLFPSTVHAEVVPEMEGMDPVIRADGTFLVGGPTYYFDRIHGAGGIHSESEMWSPAKLHYRLLLNRMSVLPSWNPMEPSVWLKTGNELGDMIYNDLLTESDRPDNRTPILEGGFRSPSYKGFWATARGVQDDHYTEYTRTFRKHYVPDEFSIFGENLPYFSSIYGGLGYTNSFINASILAGEEYIWLWGESSYWIPVRYRPRVEARADFWNLSLTAVYEDAEYQNLKKSEKGNRKELSGSVYFRCGNACKKSMLSFSAGLQFRAVDDSGHVYTQLDEDFVALPFLELQVKPIRDLNASVMFAVNDRDWLIQDSVEYFIPVARQMGILLGVKNISGTRLNPVADNAEFFGDDTIHLDPDGQMNLIQGYTAFADTFQNFSYGTRVSYWAEYGAETFDASNYSFESSSGNRHMDYRSGHVSRINQWIYGFTAEAWMRAWYNDLFVFNANTGFEHIDGPLHEFEVTPAEFFVSFTGDWYFRKSFKVSHSLHYRSDARWNLRTPTPLVVKGDWFWDATFEQQFPGLGVYLTGSILHILGNEQFESPNTNPSRIRFVCSVKKFF